MALALVLRNAPKIQAGAFQQNYLKSLSVFASRDFSLSSSCQNRPLLANHKNLTLKALSPKNQIVSSQIRLMSEDHSKLWPIEKALSVGLLVLIPASIAAPNFVFDNLAAVAAVVHMHWGLEAIAVDYVRPIIFGSTIPKLAVGLVYVISALTLGGLIYFNASDIGIGKTIRRFWAIKE